MRRDLARDLAEIRRRYRRDIAEIPTARPYFDPTYGSNLMAWLNEAVGHVGTPRRNREYQSVSQDDDD